MCNNKSDVYLSTIIVALSLYLDSKHEHINNWVYLPLKKPFVIFSELFKKNLQHPAGTPKRQNRQGSKERDGIWQPIPRMRPTLNRKNNEGTKHPFKNIVSPQKHSVNPSKQRGYWCSTRDVNILDLKENWHTRKVIQAIILTSTKLRRWPCTRRHYAPPCVTCCRPCNTTRP